MRFVILLVAILALSNTVYGQKELAPCPRPVPGASVRQPANLRSANGSLHAEFSLRSRVDVYGLTLYCYAYGNNEQSPTLRVQPGDEVVLTLKNDLTPQQTVAGAHSHSAGNACGSSGDVTASSTNLHFHGLNIPPVCHQDDVIHTLVQPGQPAFEYRFRIPADEPPGLYWYHPHPHGFTEKQVQGGASGALIVEGIERAAPSVAGVTERVLVLRDQLIGGVVEDASKEEGDEAPAPSLDLSLNYVPILYPLYKPAIMLVRPRQKEFWRVLNASADTFFNLQLLYWPTADTQVAQQVRLIAIDGVPVGADLAGAPQTSILLPPGARAEFLMETPPPNTLAQFITRRYDNGKFGDRDSYRVLANLRTFDDSPLPPLLPSVPPDATGVARKFPGLTSLQPARLRTLYFSEKIADPAHPKLNASYFLTAEGAEPKVFDMNFQTPDLTATQGTVEDWIIENRAEESHAFHIHQFHFQMLQRDGKTVNESALRDTIELPYWDGKSAYPSVKLRMDFRGPNVTGTFLYHCHILEHEDGGMMGSIQVVPAAGKAPGK